MKLVDVLSVQWLNRKSYSAVCLDVGREGRVLLRAAEGLEDWFELLEVFFSFLFKHIYEIVVNVEI